MRAEQQKRDDQRDQQFSQLSNLLASLTTLVVQSNSNQAQLLDRQAQLERQIQPCESTPQPSLPDQVNHNHSINDHSRQADMECEQCPPPMP